jgi:hypothetical protein
MMNVGPIELIIVMIIGLFSLLLPLVTIVFMFLIYDRVRRIEQRLDRLDQGPKRSISE